MEQKFQSYIIIFFSFLLSFTFSLGLKAAFVEPSCHPGEKPTMESGACETVLSQQRKRAKISYQRSSRMRSSGEKRKKEILSLGYGH